MKNNRKAVQELIKVTNHEAETVTDALGVSELIENMEDGEVDFNNITVAQEVLFLTDLTNDIKVLAAAIQSLLPRAELEKIDCPSKMLEFIINEAPEDIYNLCVAYGFRSVADNMMMGDEMSRLMKAMFGK